MDTHPQPLHDSPAKKWGSLVVLSLALAIIIIDSTILNVSLSYIIKDLKTDLQKLQWVITAYSLVLAALTITGGRLGDIFGRKRMFMLGAVLFAAGSLLASYSTSFGMLLTGESIIEGIGAALMMPATAALLVSTFHGRERALAFGVWGAIAAASSAIGPLLGGFLTLHYSWRWAFRINVVVAALLLAGSVLVKEAQDRKKLSIDWGGILLSSLGLLSLVFGIIESSTYGWWKAKESFVSFGHALALHGYSVTPLALAVGLVLLGVFAGWEARQERLGRTPLIGLGIFGNRQFTAGIVTTGVLSLGMSGMLFTLPVFFQSVRHLDALHTGYAFLPWSVAVLIMAPAMAQLSQVVRPRLIIQIGFVLEALSALALWRAMSVDATAISFLPGLSLFGAGMGMIMSQINNMTLSALPPAMAGEASGLTNTLRQLGSTIGAALLGAVLLSSVPSHISSGVAASTVIPQPAKAAISQALQSQGTNIEFAAPASGPAQSPAIGQEISRIVDQAITDANRETFLYTLAFILLGLLVSFGLPNVAPGDHGGHGQRRPEGQPASH